MTKRPNDKAGASAWNPFRHSSFVIRHSARSAVRSIRWRIQAWHGLVLLLVLASFGVTAYRLQRGNAYRRLDGGLQLRLTALFGTLGRRQEGAPPQPRPGPPPPPPREENGPPPGQPGPPPGPPREAGGHDPERQAPAPGSYRLPAALNAMFGEESGFYYRIWTRTGAVFGESANAPAEGGGDPAAMPARDPVGVGGRSRGGRREVWQFTPPGECLLVGASEASLAGELARFAGWLVAVGSLVLAGGLAGGWWLAAGAIAPIRAISATAARIAATGRPDERIPLAGAGLGSELDGLAVTLNATFARLEAAFAEQARFTSDAAHELRTPVSVILAHTQLALARPRGAEELREAVETVRRAALRMQGLIESLLTLARLDAAPLPPPTTTPPTCDLAGVAREQLDLIRPLADERGVTLGADLAPAACAADPDQVAQIFTNLLSNAVKYARPGDRVHLSTHREANGQALAVVADTGPGIAAEHLPHLFERFYRADASRNRATGGAGLGLAICRRLATAEGGTLEVTSREGEGSTFTLRLPAALRAE